MTPREQAIQDLVGAARSIADHVHEKDLNPGGLIRRLIQAFYHYEGLPLEHRRPPVREQFSEMEKL